MWICVIDFIPGVYLQPVGRSVQTFDRDLYNVEPLINQVVGGEAGMGSARWPFLKISF